MDGRVLLAGQAARGETSGYNNTKWSKIKSYTLIQYYKIIIPQTQFMAVVHQLPRTNIPHNF